MDILPAAVKRWLHGSDLLELSPLSCHFFYLFYRWQTVIDAKANTLDQDLLLLLGVLLSQGFWFVRGKF